MTVERGGQEEIIERLLSYPSSFLGEDKQGPILRRRREYYEGVDYERLKKLQVASWVVNSRWASELDEQDIGDKLAVVGPPGVGKTTLTVSLSKVLPCSLQAHFLDVFSFGSEVAIQGKPGTRKGGKKRPDKPIVEGDDVQTAIVLLQRLRDFRDSKDPITIADMPGRIRTENEWFYPFLQRSIEGLIVVGGSQEDIERWSYPLGENVELPVVAKVIVGYGEVLENNRDLISIKELKGKPTFGDGVLDLGERLLTRAAEKLVERNLLA